MATKKKPEEGAGPIVVRMISKVSGTRDGLHWPNPGETLVCGSPEEALGLIASGLAIPGDVTIPEMETRGPIQGAIGTEIFAPEPETSAEAKPAKGEG